VEDTIALARMAFPGQKNDLDSLCQRLNIDTRSRTVHGALIDARILCEAYLALEAELSSRDSAGAANMPRYQLRSQRRNTDRLETRPGELLP
jgi:DNA polymerase-3 subunit epsilon